MTALSIDELLEKAKARHHPHSGECVTCELIATLESVRDAEKGMTKADELFKKYQADGWIGPTSFKAALREYGAMVRKEDDTPRDLLELKQLVTTMMEFKRGGWVGLTVNEKLYSNSNYLGKSAEAWHGGVAWAEAILKEKNT